MSTVIIPDRFGIGYRKSPYVQPYYRTNFRDGVRIAKGNKFERIEAD